MQILTRLNKVIAYDNVGYIPVGNSAVCIATNKCYNDAHIVTVDCVPTDIDHYHYHYIDGKFIKGESNSTIIETNKRKVLQFWVGTHEEYTKLTEEDKQGLFAIITDDSTKDELTASITALAVQLNSLQTGLSSGSVIPAKASRAVTAENDASGNDIRNTYFRNVRTLKNNSNNNNVSISTGVYLVNVQLKTPLINNHTTNGMKASTILRYDGNEVTSMLDMMFDVNTTAAYRVMVTPQQDYTGNGLLTIQAASHAEVGTSGNIGTSIFMDVRDQSLLNIECIKIANV